MITVEIDGERPRTYPIRYLMWHEIVNDQIGDVPVTVTYCPLCNSGITFDRRVNGKLLSFGVSGQASELGHGHVRPRDRKLVATGYWHRDRRRTDRCRTDGPADMDGKLVRVQGPHPDGLVMAQPSFPRQYGRNPYTGYDSSTRPFLYNGEMPPHDIPALMRVVRVGDRAWTMERLREEGEITEAGVTLSWAAGQASALDKYGVGDGRDVGTVRVRDASGADLAHDVMFAFGFTAFWPDGEWMLGSS